MAFAKAKKFIVLLLIVCLLLTAAGCKASVDPQTVQAIQDAQAALEAEKEGESEPAKAETSSDDQYAEAGLAPVDPEGPIWAEAEFELPAIAQVLAYKATFPDTFDENDPSADDFWTVTGMGLTAVPPENATDFNKINHVKKAVVLDYAEALLPGYEAGDAAPSLADVYGVSDNPRSDIIDIEGIGISVRSEILMLARAEDPGNFLMRVRIEDKEGLMSLNEWDVELQSRTDGGDHVLPLEVVRFAPHSEEVQEVQR